MMPSLRDRKKVAGNAKDNGEEDVENTPESLPSSQSQTPENTGSPLLSPRRSVRERRQRVLFGHNKTNENTPDEAQNNQQEHEEKTVQEDGEGGDEDNEESSSEKEYESNEETADSDLETSFKPAAPGRGRKRLAAASNKGGQSAKKARKSATPRSRTPARKRSQKDDGGGSGSLYNIVKAGKAAIQAVVDDWIECYNRDRETAMVDLIQFFVQCCGCKGTVTGSMLEDGESVNAIRLLTEQFDEDSPEYPLIMHGLVYKKFKTNFCEFIDCLIRQCQHSIIYDDYMLDTLISWLIILSDSQVRAFRHTSTLAGMKLVTSLIGVAKNVHIEQDNTQRQLDSEVQKAAAKRSAEKVEMLQNKRDELRQNVHELEEMMNCIFQGMFVQRYRDLRPEIRAICIHEMGNWMKDYSNYFLTETYLKYTVWTLHDKVGDVRLQAINALEGLYEVEEFLPMLETLTTRFKERLLDMTMDKDPEVAVKGIKLSVMLLKYGELDEDDCHQVEQMVFCTHRQVAHAAGEFLCARIDQTVKQESPSKKRGARRSEQDIKKQTIKKFIEFIITCEIHNHAAYFVDSLWDVSPLVKDWKLMTEILMDKSGNEDLTDTEEEMLIDLMVASCKQAALGHGPPGRVSKRASSNKEKKMIADDTKTLSGHFMVVLPGLLSKFGADSRKVTNLISIPHYFDLEEYAHRRLNKHLEDLLKQLEDVVNKHSDNTVLEECSKTLRKLTDNELTLKITSEVSRTRIVDTIVKNFREALKEGLPEENEDDDDDDGESFPILVNLKRIAAFYKAHDLNQWKLYDDLDAIIKCGVSKNIHDEIMTNSLKSMMFLLLWSRASLDIDQPNKNDMNVLKKRVSQFVSQCDELLHFSRDEVKQQAFLCLSDTFVIFAKQLMNKAPLLAPLTYEADRSVQVHCREYVTSRVFADVSEDDSQYEDDDDSDAKVEDLHNKRLVLAAFCKLISYNIFNMKFAAPIFAQFIRGFANYGDIIKTLMSKCREINRKGYVQAILLSLQQAFETLREEHDQEIDKLSSEFLAIKDLAHRFALTFGVDTTKQEARHAVVTIHRDGIIYALSRSQDDSLADDQKSDVPPNLLFFEVLNEFTNRLISVDKSGKNGIIPYLAKQLHQHKVKDTSGEVWEPLHIYQDGLAGEEEEERGGDRSKSFRKGKAQSKGEGTRGRPKKKQDTSKDEKSEKRQSSVPTPTSDRPTRAAAGAKRLREESSESEGEQENQDSADEFDNNLPSGSQASWINSQTKQKAVKRTRISYGKNSTPGSRKSSRLAQDTTKDERSSQEIEEFESEEEEETPKQKTPARPRQKKKPLPENIFSDTSQEKPSSEDEGSDLRPALE